MDLRVVLSMSLVFCRNLGSGGFAEATFLLYQDKRGSLGYFERLPVRSRVGHRGS